MLVTGLTLPMREEKPRNNGLTILIDNGTPLNLFKDTIQSSSQYIDLVKFGWGTSLVTRYLKQKISWLREQDIDFFFGGTLFEKFLSQDKMEEYYHLCKDMNCRYVEISNGTLAIPNKEKAIFIKYFSEGFTVLSEVGNKDISKANQKDSTEWLENIREDIEAGAFKVMTEARESGTSGICSDDGEVRMDIFDLIKSSDIPFDRLIFEAPNKKMQTFFIEHVGSNVNLANIAFSDVISLETLRLGLRSDTFNL
ncbi:phosphosulfolactate synthase [Gracilibacillus ureilyticus]|uniref:Phosphosulfolactate synthase n=1 Tax=Gracilibacillus ureilyticus TaxID=531814 RepID=A0A1H9TBG4_9BACI|nr:phosphosulfolactate synthase [Gracilibacillus ureilyticus]SER94660.1 phosphosulfolactate synthase [Gracilibacillus ureilyticus]